MSTDKDWEKWGSQDPYYGVLSSDLYRNHKLDERAREEFFQTGREHVSKVLNLIKQNFDENLVLRSTLDFGCGVGRLVVPFAQLSESCVGVDVSTSMIEEASKNVQKAGVSNTNFVVSNGDLRGISEDFSLVHTFIVLQHIPWKRGRSIIKQLAGKVEPGGFLAAHMLTSSSAPKLIRTAVRISYVVPPLNWLRNIVRGRPMFEPAMQLHVYNTATVVKDLESLGFDKVILSFESNMAGFGNAFFLAHRSKEK